MSNKQLNIRESTYNGLLARKLRLQVELEKDLSFSDVIDEILKENATKKAVAIQKVESSASVEVPQ